ncbi:hypothetical protein CY35_03G136100 [Sphagnum magellanicum]|nr:hypothetical protein CY35_03G136100 [Sphagnum magellanicum]
MRREKLDVFLASSRRRRRIFDDAHLSWNLESILAAPRSFWRDTVRRELVLEDESGIWELASCEGVEGERSGPWHQSGQRHCGDLWHKQETRKQGHDNVADRCQKYYDAGASFAKWRAVLKTGITEPLELAIQLNAQGLARYAIICQENGYPGLRTHGIGMRILQC